jgi:hypothetical protein
MKPGDLNKLIEETERRIDPLARVSNRGRVPGGIASGLALIAIARGDGEGGGTAGSDASAAPGGGGDA